MRINIPLSLGLIGLLAATAAAVKPSTWNHETEADFTGARTTDTIVNNLGEIRLARSAEALADLSGQNSIVYDIVELEDGSTVFAAGPEGELARLNGEEEMETVAEYPGSQVFALEPTEEGLWVAISGSPSRLELRSGEDLAVQRAVELPDARYLWDVIRVGDRLWLATGTEGQVLVLPTDAGMAANGGDAGNNGDGKGKSKGKDKSNGEGNGNGDGEGEGNGADQVEPTVALESPQSNILCLDADDQGRVYAGTDEEGLVYRIEEGEGGYKPFVLYDAEEPEIGALMVRPDGTVFAGTADADQARPGRLEEATEEPSGRPSEQQEGEEPSQEPEVPNRPPEPDPKAGGDDAAESGGEAQNDGSAPAEGNTEAPDNAADSDAAEADAEAQAAEAEQPAEPSPEQYDQLRQVIRQRLQEARESGGMNMQVSDEESGSSGSERARLQSRVRGSDRSRSSGGPRNGNAIYRINPDGFVNEVFRESVMILRIVPGGNGGLLVATGNEGQLYRVDPDAGEVSILADLEPQQVPALRSVGEEGVLLGTANPGRIVRLADRYAEEGTLTSPTLDAEQVSLWGKLRITGRSPENTDVRIQTRSGNVKNPEAGVWSDWSEPETLDLSTGRSAFLSVESAPARFFQYRLTLRSDGGESPVVHGLSMKYLMPNLRPEISSITGSYGGNSSSSSRNRSGSGSGNSEEPKPRTTLQVEWEAKDQNQDELAFTLQARPFGSDAPFVTVAEDIDGSKYEWNTRTAEDGRYVLRLNASDAPDNVPGQVLKSSRTSDPVLVDNTPPRIEELSLAEADGGGVQLKAKVTDEWSPVAEVRYSVDSSKEWQLVLPEDLIYDSTGESIRLTMDDLDPGKHVVTVRATDELGNTRYASRTITVEP